MQGRADKLVVLQELAGRLGLSAAEICYMGDDEIDVPALQWAGIGATVSTAMLRVAVAVPPPLRVAVAVMVSPPWSMAKVSGAVSV